MLLVIMVLLGVAGCSWPDQTDGKKEVTSNEEVQLIYDLEVTASSRTASEEAYEPIIEGILAEQLSIPAINVDTEVEHM
ncbi:MAG: hypothetical protein WCF60_10330 [Anaerobacillus sp.]